MRTVQEVNECLGVLTDHLGGRGGGGWTGKRGEERNQKTGGEGRREGEETENGGQKKEISKGVSPASLTSLKRVWERDIV